jgi:hypothetical protein
MATPQWITPVGSLGVIPEGVFYQQPLLAAAEPLPMRPICTATAAGTNLVTCNSTAGVYAGLEVTFVGTTFGGLSENTRYFVLQVANSTQFSLTTSEIGTVPVALTAGTGNMIAVFAPHVFYRLIAGTLPTGLQLSDNGNVAGVPKAVGICCRLKTYCGIK